MIANNLEKISNDEVHTNGASLLGLVKKIIEVKTIITSVKV